MEKQQNKIQQTNTLLFVYKTKKKILRKINLQSQLVMTFQEKEENAHHDDKARYLSCSKQQSPDE